MAYSPYNALLRVYNAKNAWNNATTDEERQKQHEIANTARKELERYNYGYLADQVSADTANAEDAQKVLDAWKPKVDETTGNYKTGVDNESYNQTIGSATRKSDTAFNLMESDHKNVNSKYDDLYGYANSDLTQTDEYKSAFANIMPSYNLAAMQGRDNEVAAGGANNGGNIDSFSAANAMRQQAAITAKGQALAHQMGVDAVNARVANARGILSDLGVYNSSVYAAMDQNINTDRALANDIYANARTEKNDAFEREQIAEQSAINNGIKLSEMYGYLAPELLYRSPMYSRYFNTDGTLKDENMDYKAAIEQADKSGDTALADVLRVARGAKIFGDYAKWGEHDDGDYLNLPIVQTEPASQHDEQIEASKYAVDAATEQTKIGSTATSSDNDKQRQHEWNMLLKQLEFQQQQQQLEQQKQASAETIKRWDSAVTNINTLFKSHESNPDKIDILVNDGEGKYHFNTAITKEHWDDLVVEQILVNSAMSWEEKAQLIGTLGVDLSSMEYLEKKYS